jgi:hypothetical protein
MLAAAFGSGGCDRRKMTLGLRASANTEPLCQLTGWDMALEELE